MAEAILICGGKKKQSFEVKEATSLKDLARLFHPESEDFLSPTIAIAKGQPVLRENDGWEIEIESHELVIFFELPLGGGGSKKSNPISTVLTIVVAAVASVATAGLAGLAIGAMGLASGSIGAALVTGLIGGVMMAGASMLLGALIGNKTAGLPSSLSGAYDAAKASPTYNINSTGNQARLYQPVPELFGKMRIVPDYIAQPWVQYIGNEQYGYFVYALGRGNYDVESMSIGDTKFWDRDAGVSSAYDNIQVEFVAAGNPVTLFPDNVITSMEVSGQQLYGPNESEYSGAVGPYVTNPPGTTTNQIQLDVVLPQGIGRYNDQGSLQNYSLSIRADYRAVDDNGNAIGGWSTLITKDFSGATLTPQRQTLICDVAPGRYQVQMVRTTDSSTDGRTMDTVQWSALRAMLPGSLSYDVSAVALKIRATNTLSNSASNQVSIICTRKLPLYNRATKTWGSEVATRSWAAAVSAVCKASWGGGLTDKEIDLNALWEIGERMDARGWYYDAYIDGPTTVWSQITEMCQPMLCVPRLEGAVLSFVEDCANRPVKYMLTPRNIRRGTFKLTWNTWSNSTPDDVIMNYLDNLYGYQQRDVKAVLPESESREETNLEMLGITDREHAFRVAVGYAARNRWRRIGVECQVEGLGRLMNIGDVVTVSHPRLRNTASGKIDNWDEKTLTLTLRKDNGVLPTSGALYLSLSRPDGTIWGPCKLSKWSGSEGSYSATFDAADYANILVSEGDNPWGWITDGIGSLPTLWIAQSAKEFNRRMLVQSVVPSDLLTYTVNLVNDDDRVYSYDYLTAPAWQGRGQLPTESSLDSPRDLAAWVDWSSGSPIVEASWLPVNGAEAYDVEYATIAMEDIPEDEYATPPLNWLRAGRTNVNRISVAVPIGKVYLRVCAIRDTLQSSWTVWVGYSNTSTLSLLAAKIEDTENTVKVSWDSAENATYGVNLIANSGKNLLVQNLNNTEYEITPEIARELDTTVDQITVKLWAKNSSGLGPVTTVKPREERLH